MSPPKLSTVSSRINIPVSPDTRQRMEDIASRKGVSLAELGRQALETYLVQEQRKQRLLKLKDSASKYSDIIEGVAEEWRVTEVEGWLDD